jgi:ABC-type nickel/cobalt efflux system permease component RcnA
MIAQRLAACVLVLGSAASASAHPLGNFSVNRWAGLEGERDRVRVHYVVDFAEIPTYQELGDRVLGAEEAGRFARSLAERVAPGLHVVIDGRETAPSAGGATLTFASGAGGLRTMRLESTYDAALPDPIPSGGSAVSFTDDNFVGRAGWREVIAWSGDGAAVASASVPSHDQSSRLTSYPRDLVSAPPQVSQATLRLLGGTEARAARDAGTAALADAAPRAGDRVARADGFAALIHPSGNASLGLMLAAFAAALFWGGAHALSPGHGKTVVAAYLVGQRGAPRHAIWLGLIVTVTHTIGVFALGGLTLVLSRFFVPESVYPWLGFVSGATVTVMGMILLVRRFTAHRHHDHDHHHGEAGHDHTHAVPLRLTFRGLLALGISGGIVPCPTALVVLLSAIAFHRVVFGMALIAAFSLGLAGVLVGVGLTMVYARSIFDRFDAGGGVTQKLGQFSAAAIALLGIGIMLKSLPAPIASLIASPALAFSGTAFGVLGLGLIFGLRHATEGDHIAAVSAIVSERRGWRSAVGTGALWGAGHTLSILAAGVLVLVANVVIPAPMARALEFGVALMIIALGGVALARALRSRTEVHVHAHAHGRRSHGHLHFHAPEHEHAPRPVAAHHDHTPQRIGLKPLAVGMMHGLAGSAALTLLVLAQIHSTALGLAYLFVFGLGSIGGMALMSLMISVPFAATMSRPGLHRAIRVAAGFLSLAFGLFYAWTQLAPGAGA